MVLRIAPTPPPTPPRLCPESSACIFLPSGPSEPRLATTERRLTRQRYEPPRTSPDFSRLCHGGATNHAKSAWFCLIRGSAPKTLNFLKFLGQAPDQPRITKNHPDSPRTSNGSPQTTQTLLGLTPIHPDSRFVAHSAPDSGMCNWALWCRKHPIRSAVLMLLLQRCEECSEGVDQGCSILLILQNIVILSRLAIPS